MYIKLNKNLLKICLYIFRLNTTSSGERGDLIAQSCTAVSQ